MCSFPNVSGAYDLVLNNYGPDKFNGSVHIEVPDTCRADELDELLRAIQVEVFKKHQVILTAIGVYSVNTTDEKAAAIREEVRKLVMETEHIVQMHGFYYSEEKKLIRFDIIVSFDAKDRRAVYAEVCRKVQERWPDHTLQIAMDTDFAES